MINMEVYKARGGTGTRWDCKRIIGKGERVGMGWSCLQDNLKMFASFSYENCVHGIERVKSTSTVRTKGNKFRIIRPRWLKMTPDGKNKSVEGKIEDNNKEIEKLNSKIRNLIKENFELKGQAYGNSFRNIRHNKEIFDTFRDDLESSGRSAMEVTFRPSDYSESPVKISKRFPRDVFSVPKYLERVKQ